MLSAHDVRYEDISDLVGRSSTSVTEPVYRHEIRSMLTKGRDGHEPQFECEDRQADLALLRETHWLPGWLPKLKPKNPSDQSGRRDLNPRPLDPRSRMTCLAWSGGVGRGASHLQERPKGVAGSLNESTRVGSPSWLPWLPSGGRGTTPCQPRSTTTPWAWRSTVASSQPRRSANTPRLTVGAHGSSRPTRAAFSPGTRPSRAMVLAERLAAGYGDDDPFVVGWREELGL